jgi:hypothetical protein
MIFEGIVIWRDVDGYLCTKCMPRRGKRPKKHHADIQENEIRVLARQLFEEPRWNRGFPADLQPLLA